jgi:alpha-mannosidase
MHDYLSLLEQRVARILKEKIRPAIYGESVPLTAAAWDVPGEPVPPAEGLSADYQPFAVGEAWGYPWSTTWFRFEGQVPAGWPLAEVEAVIDIGFRGERTGFTREGLIYDAAGKVVKGLEPRSRYVPAAAVGGSGPDRQVVFYVEAAGNPDVLDDHVPTPLGDPATIDRDKIYHLDQAVLALFNRPVWELAADTDALYGLMRELHNSDPRKHQVGRALERMLDQLDLDDVAGTAGQAAKELSDVLAQRAVGSAHRISAIGNAHIDTAWLWPLRETHRKVARTVANALALAEDDPGYIFAFSQAQQLDWLKSDQPELYTRLKAAFAAGSIVAVGGLWVEPDGNLPGGEAMARQMVYGKRFFIEEFGIETEDVWMPDSFGYSGALPQIARLAANRWMLTQKMSWNETNRFPHHTFWWEGIDGTRIFTHFPPADTYNAQMTAAELAHASRNFAEHGNAGRSLLPFGYGDGGGGPTREMLAAARRFSDLEGLPRVSIESPRTFFEAAEAEYHDAPVWSGELYLEKHRGVLTTQALTKRGNRRSEHLLREVELWAATAAHRSGFEYPYEAIEKLWKQVLVLQFHDILPGSSIAWVYDDAATTYEEIAAVADTIITAALSALGGDGSADLLVNSAPHPRDGVPAMGSSLASQRSVPETSVTVSGPDAAGDIVLDNGLLRVRIDAAGLIGSIEDLVAARQVLAPGARANLLQLHPDFPVHWDAWDVDASYRNTHQDLVGVDEIAVIESEPLRAAVRVARSFGASHVTQIISLAAGETTVGLELDIDWRESEKFLKVAFPFDVHADRAASEIQFGHVYRPTHVNTSWDDARFETAAHRWVHVGEPGYGVAVSSTSIYGHDVGRSTRDDGGTTTTLRLSLLRAPRYPDPEADLGHHHFSYVLHPGASITDAVIGGYRTNLPIRSLRGASSFEGLVGVDTDSVVVEAVKLSDDREGDVVVRLYEAAGGRGRAVLTAGFEVAELAETDLLERPLGHPSGAVKSRDGAAVSLELRPFQILTLRLSPAQ